ncbi:MAG: cytochrome P450 [Chloroflexi bacterium]|nr:cytochrome P450 [Chloroflexota bacterium]
MPVLDVFAPELAVDPYPAYARLRAHDGVRYRSPSGRDQPPLVLSRYADVALALRDPRFGRAGAAERLRASLGDGPLSRTFARWMLFQDPPDHTRLRRLVQPAFTPRAVEQLEDCIRDVVRRLIEPLPARRAFDVLTEFAAPLPVLVICALLGVPKQDWHRFGGWSAALAASLDHLTAPESVALRRGDAAAAGLTAYFQELIATRRQNLGQDVVSQLLRAADDRARLNEDELIATCILLFFAGHETTVNLIGNGLLALLRHPEQLRQLQQASEAAPTAIEELLRFDSPVQRTARVALDDMELKDGDVIRASETVIVLIGAANRDPAQFRQPDRLDLTRPDASRHLAFGAGIHHCLGAPLARLEAQVALTELVRHVPRLRLVDDRVDWRPTFSLRGLRALPVSTS